jgi:hypothetical protein
LKGVERLAVLAKERLGIPGGRVEIGSSEQRRRNRK